MACAFGILALAPDWFLASLGITDIAFSVVSLTRVIAVLLVVVAAAVLPVPSLVGNARSRALMSIGLAYAVGTLLILTQEIAIWSTTGGAIIAGIAALFAVAFIGVRFLERSPVDAAV
ncbi:MAG: hypothetical protein ACHQQP_03240 [Gemmatimonadales bacterium]